MINEKNRQHAPSASPSGMTRREAVTGLAGLTFAFSLPVTDAGAKTAARDPMKTAWVTISPDDKVTIVSPAAEMGQGSRTSLALIIAEELDADWSKVTVEMSPLDDKIYGNPRYRIMYTAGSASVPTYFKPLRLHAAQARRALLDAAAGKWSVPVGELTTEPSVVLHKASGRKMTYGQIAAFATMPATLPAVTEADLKPFESFRYLGKDVTRVELPSKLDGSAKYSIDVQVPGMLYGAVLRAPTEGSSPATIDKSAAEKIPGVKSIVALPYGVGILATSPEAAFAGQQKLAVTWSATPASSFNSVEALARYTTRAKNLTEEGKVWDKAGDIAKMNEAATVVEAVYQTDFAYHAQMEPLNALAAVSAAGDAVEVWCGTQAPTTAQAAVARALNIGVDKVTLHAMLLGGGFGRRGHYDAEYVVDAALLSKAAKAPVKVIWTREDDIKNGRFRPMTAHYLKAGIANDGAVLAWRHRVCSEEALAFQDGPRFKARNERPVFSMLGTEQPSYDFPNRLIDHVRATDGMRLSSMRGTGNPPNAFVTESFIDELAAAAKTDPMQFRRNLVAKVPRALHVLDVLSEMSNWRQARPEGTGLGLCFRNEDGTLIGMVAEVSVDRKTGVTKVRRVWAVIDAGLAVQPDNIVAQIQGAIIYTLGAALTEQITMVGGAVQQNNFYDYAVPRMSDVPDIEVRVVSTPNAPTGIGEMGGNITGAVGNAIAAATGTRVRHMPMTPDRVLAALKA
jgi:isoquinoline 1-oxidoreductase beta subunit